MKSCFDLSRKGKLKDARLTFSRLNRSLSLPGFPEAENRLWPLKHFYSYTFFSYKIRNIRTIIWKNIYIMSHNLYAIIYAFDQHRWQFGVISAISLKSGYSVKVSRIFFTIVNVTGLSKFKFESQKLLVPAFFTKVSRTLAENRFWARGTF